MEIEAGHHPVLVAYIHWYYHSLKVRGKYIHAGLQPVNVSVYATTSGWRCTHQPLQQSRSCERPVEEFGEEERVHDKDAALHPLGYAIS